MLISAIATNDDGTELIFRLTEDSLSSGGMIGTWNECEGIER